MNHRHAISLIQTGYTTVQVCYDLGVDVPPELPTMLGSVQQNIGGHEEAVSPPMPWIDVPPTAPWQGPAQPAPAPNARDGRAKIQPPKLYTFKAPLDKVNVGDLVVVSGTNGPSIARVHIVHPRPKIDLTAPYAYKWIIDVVDTAGYQKLMQDEEKLEAMLLEAEQQRARKQLLDDLLEQYPEGSEVRKLLSQASVAEKILDLPVNPNVIVGE